MMSQFIMGAFASISLSFAASAIAQDTTQSPPKPAAPAHAESGLPFCSAKVKDRCIQKSDLKREGKPTAAKKG